MSTLLEVLLTFVGVMFILALAAQNVQELLKAAFVIKGQTMLAAVAGLVREAVRAQGQWSIDADAILKELSRRLDALGQGGFRKGKLRLDSLPATQLRALIAGIDPGLVPGLPVEKKPAQDVLVAIAAQAEQWYPLAVDPVDDRYRRRMRVLALLASAIVVIPLNAGAKRICDAARTDAAFRLRVAGAVDRLDSLSRAQTGAAGTVSGSASDSSKPVVDSVPQGDEAGRAALAALVSKDDPLLRFGPPTLKDFESWGWWLEILVSVLFVSLGAPVWHDLLETLFSLKVRLGPLAPPNKDGEGSESKAG